MSRSMRCASSRACTSSTQTDRSRGRPSAPTRRPTQVALLLRGLRAQLSVDLVDEHVRRPRARRRAVVAVVVERRMHRLDLIERLALLEAEGDAVADDRRHVAVLDDVALVQDAAVAGDDARAALLVVLWHGHRDDLIQAVDDAGNCSAALRIDV